MSLPIPVSSGLPEQLADDFLRERDRLDGELADLDAQRERLDQRCYEIQEQQRRLMAAAAAATRR